MALFDQACRLLITCGEERKTWEAGKCSLAAQMRHVASTPGTRLPTHKHQDYWRQHGVFHQFLKVVMGHIYQQHMNVGLPTSSKNLISMGVMRLDALWQNLNKGI